MRNRILTLVVFALLLPLAAAGQTVTMEPNLLSTAEAGGDPASITFRRTGSTATALVVFLTVLPESTAQTNDYEDNTSGQFEFLNSVTLDIGLSEFTVLLTASPDNLVEGQETLTFELADNSNYTVGTDGSLTVTFDDDPPVVDIRPAEMDPANLTATEGGMPALLDISRSGGDLASSLLVRTQIDPSSTASFSDYQDNLNGQFDTLNSVTIPEQSTVLRLELTATPDNLAEGEETLDIRLTGNGYVNGTASQALVTIADDSPLLIVSVLNDVTAEGGGPASIEFTRAGGLIDQPLRVNTAIEGSSSAAARDFTDNVAEFFLILNFFNIPADETSFTLELTAVQDGLIEGTEVLDFSISGGEYEYAGASPISITVLDTLIFDNGFEGGSPPGKCLPLEEALQFLDHGPETLQGGLVWRTCRASANYDWKTKTCVTEPSLPIPNRSTFVSDFNDGKLADSDGYRWRLATDTERRSARLSATDCLVRSVDSSN
ncbi:MAG: hypothetical protein AAF358_12295 [Pseudomonadota bacterium]